jgi:hypothetical protein
MKGFGMNDESGKTKNSLLIKIFVRCLSKIYINKKII